MAVALDASTPARWTGTPNRGAAITMPSPFTAPANSYLVVCIERDGSSGGGAATYTVSDSSGLTWNNSLVERTEAETTTGGGSKIAVAVAVASVARTVTVTRSADGDNGVLRVSATCYVYTGVDILGTPVDVVTASNEGGSATVNFTTTSLTPGATGVIVACGTDFNAKGACTSSDLRGVDSVVGSGHAEYAGAIDVIDGWHTVTSGVGASANLTAFAATPQWKWCQIIVREAAGGGGATNWGPWMVNGLNWNRLVQP